MRMEKLLQTYWIELLFIGLLVVAIITGNKTVGISAAIVLALRLLRVTPALELLSAKGINWGIIVLTVGFLAPLAGLPLPAARWWRCSAVWAWPPAALTLW